MVQPKLTYNACKQCQHRRAKCDGKQPCGRCQRHRKECQYEERHKESKDDLRRTAQELRSRQQNLDIVFQGLATSQHTDSTLKALWRHEPLDQIALKLSKGDSKDGRPGEGAMVLNTDSSSQTSPKKLQSHVYHADTRDATQPPRCDDTTPKGILGSRKDEPSDTSVTKGNDIGGDHALEIAQSTWGVGGLVPFQMRQLLSVFFDCQYIPFFTIDKDLFMHDFLNGGHDHCSPALLRSIICQACRVVAGYDAHYSFYVNLGDRLFHESIEFIENETFSKYLIPNAQALGLAALHQLGLGNKTEASQLVEEAIQRVDNSLRADGKHSARSPPTSNSDGVLIGLITLARVIRMAVCCLNNCPASHQSSVLAKRKPAFLLEDSRLEDLLSTPESADMLTQDLERFPALCAQLASCVYCTQSKVQTPSTELPQVPREAYAECLSTYDSILREHEDKTVGRPALHFTHLFYHFCLLTLFRPFCHLRAVESNINPRNICLEAAQAILVLSKSYNEQISPSVMIPCFVPLFVYTASVACAELLNDYLGTGERTTQAPSVAGSSAAPSSSVLRSSGVGRDGFSQDLEVMEDSPLGSGSSLPDYPATAEVIDHLAAIEGAFPVAHIVKQQLQDLNTQLQSQNQ